MLQYIYIASLVFSNILSWFILKQYLLYNLHWIYVILACLLFAMSPILMIKALNYTSMTKLNVYWGVFNMLLITALGVLYYSDKFNIYNGVGIALILCSIILINQ